jgi:hypothetical protein
VPDPFGPLIAGQAVTASEHVHFARTAARPHPVSRRACGRAQSQVQPDGRLANPRQSLLYDLEKDPLEMKNIAAPGFKKNKQRKALRKLQNTRASAEATRLSLL